MLRAQETMLDNPLILFGIIFPSLLILAGILLAPSGFRYQRCERKLKQHLSKQNCPLCGRVFGDEIQPYRPPYDPSTPIKERIYDYWTFHCGHCRGSIWIDTEAEIVGSHSPEEWEYNVRKPVKTAFRRQTK